jgi:hypothetical protein
MAAARKKYKTKRGPDDSDVYVYSAFIQELLSGEIKATRLHEGRKPNGQPDFEYDDPQG